MKKLCLCLLSALISVPLVLSPAFAGTRQGALTLSPMVGGYIFEGQQNMDNGPIFGLGVDYAFTKALSAELFYGFIASENDAGKDTDSHQGRLDALYHFRTDKSLVPYLAAGLGGMAFDSSAPQEDTFLLDWGVGAKYFFSEDWALRADARHIFTTDDSNHNLALMAGVSYLIGGARAQEAAMAPRDSDGDGVSDDRDRCPDTPRGVKVDQKGCPLDSDGDGVTDDRDKCPATPRGEFVDADGCTLKLTLHINFDFDKAEIKPEFEKDLDGAARFILEHKDVPYILIAGYTDSVGEADYNQQLSERRAQAVVEYLVGKYDIERRRLAARGYGEEKSVASNDTEEGRYENRRVEVICCVLLPQD
jgi:OOP family OmpA-OmpF porin